MTWDEYLQDEAWLDLLGSDQEEFEQSQAQLRDAEWLAFIDQHEEYEEMQCS